MAENARPPVAVRIVRPYDTEEAFLESELETVGKTSVILIGAHARPQGVILRFEVTLQNGNVVLRGEGRVLQHKDSAFRGQPGLALRFTRLDPKSKALVDRAGAIREARLAGSMPPVPPSSRDAAPPPPPTPEPVSISDGLPPPSSIELSSADLEPASEPEPQAHPTSPPTARPPAPDDHPDADEPLTAKPPPLAAHDTAAPEALGSVPSFVPLAIPTGLPLAHLAPSAPPRANATIAPDAELAAVLTAPTPLPPPIEDDEDEAKTRPGKRAELIDRAPPVVEEPLASTTVHATTTVAAPPIVEHTKPTDTAVTRVADRDALLARLRERRASMSEERERATRAKRE